ncbi:MAG TPA: alpha/beta fold hydrolase [Phycisphaerae bacterium]|nr:alpha/beta fold hydrolase [Phycisphaerae bacterium]
MSKSRFLSSVRICALTGVVVLLSPLPSYAQYDISDEDAVAAARKFAKRLLDGRFEDAAELTIEGEPSKFAVELKQMFEKHTKDLGKFTSFGKPSVESMGDRKLVSLPTHFERGFLNLTVLVNYQSEVVWIKYQTRGVSAGINLTEIGQLTSWNQEKATFGNSPWTVNGKLTRPKSDEAVPAVVLVPSSGPHDEDATMGANRPFLDLAQGLGLQGIAVLRYPNRAFAYKDKLKEQKSSSVREEMIEDVLEALKFLRRQKGIDKSRIYLLGFDFGGAVAAQIAKEDKNIAGVILMASSPRNVADVIQYRLEYAASLPGPGQAQAKKALEQSRGPIATLREGTPPGNAMLLGWSASLWKDMNGYCTKSAEILAGLDCRILIAGAGRDYEVTRVDFDAYKKALKGHPKVKFKWYKAMNHYFARGDGKSSPMEYEKEASVDPVVIEQLGKWIKAGEESE